MKPMHSIHQATVSTLTLPPHHSTNGYLIGGDGEAVLIDPIFQKGNPLDACLQANRIRSIQYAAVTHPHPDHHGGIDRLLAQHGGHLLCHRGTAEPAVFHLADGTRIKALAGGEAIKAGPYTLQALHTPGHSPAHLSFYIAQEGILFSGDTILGCGTAIISPPEGDMADYLTTLRNLAAMDIRTICPAHGPVITEGVQERIEWYIAHRLMREARVLEALREGLSTPSGITRRIYDEADFRMHGHDLQPRAERTVLAHLEKLEKEGVVVRQANTDSLHFHIL
ncbi:MBL fold metallo-hydrolase [Desulfatitalea alkaliphila]|uniref:MBL fold metallo-hydrolase n=1 Tax=Desulfatitalea alkaliphila TaxID=2929485 RepID=A0AA41UI97_9BACT|nr:MBL fold metallo-hydrolase [Desulfatitalea alkaliphila]MCJ8499844.1 MBL fold metallo-hydrolase [Desulfatitalea alkaliphila]